MASQINLSPEQAGSITYGIGLLTPVKTSKLTKKQEINILAKLDAMRQIIVHCAMLVPGVAQIIIEALKKEHEEQGSIDRLIMGRGHEPVTSLFESITDVGSTLNFKNGKDRFLFLTFFNGFQLNHQLRWKVIDYCCKLIENKLPELHGCMLRTDSYHLYRSLISFQAVHLKFKNINERLFHSNLGLVHYLCAKFRHNNSHLEYSDLFQEACHGLLVAIERFKIGSNNRFFTYAHYWVLAYLDLAVKNKERTVRIPAHAVTEINKINQSKGALLRLTGKQPSNKELAVSSGVPYEKIIYYSNKTAPIASLNAEDDNGVCYQDRVGTKITPETLLTDRFDQKVVIKLINKCLSSRSRKIINLRFGLSGGTPMPFKQIANSLELSESVVHNDYRQSIKILCNQTGLKVAFADLKATA